LLTDKITDKLADLLFHHTKLCEVYLRWNSLSGVCGQKVFKVLLKGDTIKVLDLSWNVMGDNFKTTSSTQGCMDELRDFIITNESLVHFDLSNNYFNFKQCENIAKALRRNQKIYGFHFTGNKGYLDA
jgi:Ran GTPase-activating protein (RanGAP) involved in mRNA processing and transport